MTAFAWIITATFAVSLISFVGVLILFLKERLLDKIILFIASFSAGALFGAAFLDLLPEAFEKMGAEDNFLMIFGYLIAGFCTFFILEQFIGWHHHHAVQHPETKPLSYLILISDSLHNFLDGLIIAGSFMASPALGLVTTVAVAFHEIPQEIGNMGVLIFGGMKKAKAVWLNFISALTAIFGGIVGYLFSERIGDKFLFLLPFAAGSFIYIAASDLIPQIRQERGLKKSLVNFLMFLLGIGLIRLLTGLLA